MVWLRGDFGPLFFLSLFLRMGFFNCMKKGYYQITEAIKNSLEVNDHINQITWGDIFDVDFRKMDMYPLGHVITGNATFNERTITYEFDILVMDIVDYSKEPKDLWEGNMMKQDIYHRTLSTLSEFLATFRRGDEYDDYFRLANDPVAEPFDEDMEANICGWKITMQIEAMNPNNIC